MVVPLRYEKQVGANLRMRLETEIPAPGNEADLGVEVGTNAAILQMAGGWSITLALAPVFWG